MSRIDCRRKFLLLGSTLGDKKTILTSKRTQIDTDSLDSLSRACLTARFGVTCTAVLASWRKEEGGNTRAGTVVCYSGMVCITYINSKTPA